MVIWNRGKTMAKHNEIGKLGEDIACDFLIDKGFTIIARNYRKPYGEIDIVAREMPLISGFGEEKTRFVEVKSVSYETLRGGGYRPEENVHREKVKRLRRVIEVYLASHHIGQWQFDIVTVSIDRASKTARVKHIENIVLGS